jgi:malonyl-ACP decarboxylase/3-oxoacyl-[acyl-carrier-protein] synthase-1/3-oxoacyl-[acyl-carrier-protein] synthase II
VLSVISELLTLRGPSFTVGGACATGNLGIMVATDLLRSGRVDAALVTGASNDLDPPSLHSWVIIEALSFKSFNDDPARASRPFDALREGFVPSQGAAAVVLETLAGARARGARVRAEVLGAAGPPTRAASPSPTRTARCGPCARHCGTPGWTRAPWTT